MGCFSIKPHCKCHTVFQNRNVTDVFIFDQDKRFIFLNKFFLGYTTFCFSLLSIMCISNSLPLYQAEMVLSKCTRTFKLTLGLIESPS